MAFQNRVDWKVLGVFPLPDFFQPTLCGELRITAYLMEGGVVEVFWDSESAGPRASKLDLPAAQLVKLREHLAVLKCPAVQEINCFRGPPSISQVVAAHRQRTVFELVKNAPLVADNPAFAGFRDISAYIIALMENCTVTTLPDAVAQLPQRRLAELGWTGVRIRWGSECTYYKFSL